MSEQMVVSLWSSMASWCTPTTLFLFLNLMIGTIVVTSRFTSHSKNNNPPDQLQQQQQHQPGFDSFHQLGRPPSLLDRVKSINFSGYRPESAGITAFRQAERDAYQNQNPDPDSSSSSSKPQLVKTPSLIDRVKMFNFSFNQYDPSEHTHSGSGSGSDRYVEYREAATESEFDEPRANIKKSASAVPETFTTARKSEFDEPRANIKKSASAVPETFTTARESEFDEPRAIIKKSASAVPETFTTATGSRDILVKLKRSVSEKLGFGRVETEEEEEEEETVERRRPATTREKTKKKKHGGDGGGGGGESDTASSGDEECVDAKADDFINKFRQQLKLQRLKSLLRYSEMINRGSSK